MYYILIGIVVIYLLNFLFSKINLLDEMFIKKYKKHSLILERFRRSFNINLKTHLLSKFKIY